MSIHLDSGSKMPPSASATPDAKSGFIHTALGRSVRQGGVGIKGCFRADLTLFRKLGDHVIDQLSNSSPIFLSNKSDRVPTESRLAAASFLRAATRSHTVPTITFKESTILGPIQDPIRKQGSCASVSGRSTLTHGWVLQSKNELLVPHRYKVVMLSANQHAMHVKKVNKQGQEVEKYYKRTKELGSGGFGTVHKFKLLGGKGKSKAVKFAYDTDDSREKLAKGAAVLNEQLVNPHTGRQVDEIPGLVPAVKYLNKADGLALIKFFNLGDLFSEGDGSRPPPVDESFAAIGQLCFGLNHLHTEFPASEQLPGGKPARCHRDIKGGNILHLNANGKTKYAIADVDDAHLAKGGDRSATHTEGFVSETDHLIMNDRSMPLNKRMLFNNSLDVRALGLSLRSFMQNQDERKFIIHAVKDDYGEIEKALEMSDFPSGYLAGLTADQHNKLARAIDLINWMTAGEWTKRPTMQQVMEYLKDYGFDVPTYDDV